MDALNNNGQAITLSKALADEIAVDGASLAQDGQGKARIHVCKHLYRHHAMDTMAGGGEGINPL